MSKEEKQPLVDEKIKKDKDKLPVWHEQQELILKNWSEIGSSYRYLHDRSFTKYNKQNLRFALPVIVISTITGTANFAQESFPDAWASYVPLAIGLFSSMPRSKALLIKSSSSIIRSRTYSLSFCVMGDFLSFTRPSS